MRPALGFAVLRVVPVLIGLLLALLLAGSVAGQTVTIPATSMQPAQSLLAQSEPAKYAADRILVRYKAIAGHAAKESARSEISADLVRSYTIVPNLELLHLPEGHNVADAIAQLERRPDVQYAEPDYQVHGGGIPNDPLYPYLWGMSNIRAPAAWDVYTGTASTVVAIIDTGIDYTHSDLAANMWHNPGEIAGDGIDNDDNGFIDDVYGYDFVNDDNDPFDDHGHGTHTAGIVGAVGKNGLGVTGVNWNVKLMTLKFLDNNNYGYNSDAIAALQYAVAKGVRISNNSWGCSTANATGCDDLALYEAIDSARSSGHLFIAAAGNSFVSIDNDRIPFYPASYPLDNIVAVTAIDHSGNKWAGSSFGRSAVDLGAPGVSILSTWPGNNYSMQTGTSMAAPHVAGVAALLWGKHPDWTYGMVRDTILGTTRPVGSLYGVTSTGGTLDAGAALREEASNKPPALLCTAIDVYAATSYAWPSVPGPLSRNTLWRFECHASDPDPGDSIASVKMICAGGGPGDRCWPSNEVNLVWRSGDTWSLEGFSLVGANRVKFVATDSYTVSTATQEGWIWVDQAPPKTVIALNWQSDSSRWSVWSNVSVVVTCSATDSGLGTYVAGVSEVRHRVNGGVWQVHAGSEAVISLGVSQSVECIAIDNAGNVESPPVAASFEIDRSAPSWSPMFQETHGVASGIWQKFDNVPSFTWAPASDGVSGVRGYNLYFGPDPNGESSEFIAPCNPCQWTPQPSVATGIFYLRGKACDNAGNCTSWTVPPQSFEFRYDGTPPGNPLGATHALSPTVLSGVWQRVTSLPDLTWPPAVDVGSGIKGYDFYWGTNPRGTPDLYTTAPAFSSSVPLCATDDTCIGYLNVRSKDNVDLPAQEVSTIFALQFDNTPPSVDFTINNGITTTSQTLIFLDLTARDANLTETLEGSGVTAMRLSNDGQSWTEWTEYKAKTTWAIPAISRQWWPIYVQVRDAVGLPSEVISHSIYFDVNRGPVKSEGFWLFDEARSSGAGGHASPSFSGRSTVGETVGGTRINSLNYVIVGGFEAASQAIPIVEPGYETYSLINGIYASGSGAATLRSPMFSMSAVVGEIGLPNNAPWASSAGYRLQPSFLAAAPSQLLPPVTCPPGGCTPPPEPPPGNCEFPQITINNGALFTNTPDVMLSVCAPGAVEMMFSNDGGFPGAQWEPYSESRSWTVTTYGQEVLPRFVYAAFRRADGSIDAVYFDDVIYDPTAPTGNVMIGDGLPMITALARIRPMALATTVSDGTLQIYLNGRDGNSGVAEMQVSDNSEFTDAVWEPYSSVKLWTPTGSDGPQSVYVRLRDNAMNVSGTGVADFLLDREGPIGSMSLSQYVLGQAAITTTVVLTATDAVSGVADVRVGSDIDLDEAIWLPYPSALEWVGDLDGPSSVTLYAQFRDWAGNVSAVYSDTYALDTAPPDVHVTVSSGNTLTRVLSIEATDGPAAPQMMRLSNDPFMVGSVTLPYQQTVEWTFEEGGIVWVQVQDSVGNMSEPYPAWASVCTAGPAPVTSLAVNGTDAVLSWFPDETILTYEVWISEDPYFNPDDPGDVVPITTTETSYQHVGAASSTTNYYYVVRGTNQCGSVTGSSSRTGEFTFRLERGN